MHTPVDFGWSYLLRYRTGRTKRQLLDYSSQPDLGKQQFPCIRLGKEGGSAASMPEEDFFISFEESMADEVNQAGSSTTCVDRIEQDRFLACKKQYSFLFRSGQNAIPSRAISIIHKDFFGMKAGFKL